MLIGIFQCDAGGLTPLQRVEKLATVLEHNALDLIVCPELFLTGYNIENELKQLAQEEVGSALDQIAQTARATKTAIVFGYPEFTGENLYNVALCLSADGDILGKHRKLILPPGFEADVFKTGEGISLFDLGGFRCGMLICYDAEHPETVRALAHAGAELVIVPTALYADWGFVAKTIMPTRAFENGVWLIYANHAGSENGERYLGSSCIIPHIPDSLTDSPK